MNAHPPSTVTHAALPHHPDAMTLRLGNAGLIPFAGGALFIWLLNGRIGPEPFAFVVNAVASYAALIVSFLGGIHWGLAMKHSAAVPGDTHALHRSLWSGIAWSLAAWVAVSMPAHAGLVVLGALLLGCYVNDRKLYVAMGVGSWLTMRFRLTAVASFSCFLSAAQI